MNIETVINSWITFMLLFAILVALLLNLHQKNKKSK